jgi:transcriptional regulator with XRE-family HTH domain
MHPFFRLILTLMPDKIYSDVRANIGLRFKKFRKQKKLSYRKVEAITGIDHSWISKFEKGRVNFEIDTLLKLASGLKIQISDLTDFTHDFVDE